jgi:Domain of unknown function (DUF5658)
MPAVTEPTYPGDRRSHTERRNLRISFAGTNKGGQRRQVRRVEDRRKIFLLDHYPKSLLVAAITILLLSLSDAVLTLILIDHGAVELNPIMAYLLRAGLLYFLGAKYLLTAAAVTAVLVFHYYPMRVLNKPLHSFLKVFTLIFSAVIVWQIYLITRFGL